MQEKSTQNAKLIISRLKSALNFTTDVELSDFLGISTQGISSWKSRNSVDYDLIFAKCGYMDLNWLFRGTQFEDLNQVIDEAPISESMRPQLRPHSDPNVLPMANSPGQVQNKSPDTTCLICPQKDKIISALEGQIRAMEKTIKTLEGQQEHVIHEAGQKRKKSA